MSANGSADGAHGASPLVTFSVIGAGKAGTTWLFEVLDAHPNVAMARAKETMFFDEHFHRGVDWYHSLFSYDGTPAAVGEVSNSYLAAPQAPARMASYNPDMRLVALLRDPVDRALSNYLFFVRNGQVRGSFEDALEARPDMLAHGFYGRGLTAYLREFPRAALHVEAFDDLQADPVAVAARVLDHIGLPGGDVPEVALTQVLAASKPRNRALAALFKNGAVMARRLGAPALVTRVKRGALPRYLYEPLDERPEIAPETVLRLRELYADDVALLAELTGRDWAELWWNEAGELSRAAEMPRAG